MLQLLKEAATARGVKIRVLVPMDKKIKNEMANQLQDLGIDIRYNKKPSQTKITTLVVDNAVSLTVELKDDSKEASEEEEEAIGLATYSNSESTVLAYVSIFENMRIQSQNFSIMVITEKNIARNIKNKSIQQCTIQQVPKEQ
jgi:two-component system, OmpR family, sensor histidine kinase VicK